MKNTFLIFLLLLGNLVFAQQKEYRFSKKPIWSDEFAKEGLVDSSKWSYNTGGHGWGNHELQYYTKASLSNVRVEKGTLKITARKEKFEQNEYTS